MTNPSAILDALHKAGATLVVEDGKTRVRGAKISDELMAALKANREAVVAEWKRRQDESRDRYGKVPTGEVPLLGSEVSLTQAQRVAVMLYAYRQPRPVHAWLSQRMQHYYEQGLKHEEFEPIACVDLLCWQLNRDAKAAILWLDCIEECARVIRKEGL